MIKKILTYSFGEVLVRGVSFLAIPLYSYLILPEEYGVLGFLSSITAFLPFIFTFYYMYGYVRFSVEIESQRLISTYIYLGLLLNIFYFFAAIVLYFTWVYKYDINLKYFILSISSSSAIYIFQILQMYHRSKGLAKSYIKFSILYSISGLVLNFLLLLLFQDNIFAMLLSSVVVSSIVSIVAYKKLRPFIDLKLFDKGLAKKVLYYTVPLVPGAISLLLFSSADKIILIDYIPKETLGIYTFAFTLGLVMSYIGSAFFMSYQPLFYEKISKGKKGEIKEQFWKNILFILGALLLSLAVISVVYRFVEQKYVVGIEIAYMISIAYSYITFAQMMELHLTHIKKTSLVSLVYGVGGVLTVILLFVLIPQYGSIGASYALVLSAFIISVLMYITAQKNLFIAYQKSSILSFYGMTFFLVWICT